MQRIQEKAHPNSPSSVIGSNGDCPPVPRLGFWERSLDLSVGLISLLLLSPVIFVTCLFIKLVSHGPVIFKQERIGKDGCRFMMYKFRTMHTDAREEHHQAHAIRLIRENRPMVKLDSTGDSRMIPFGKFLRASGLDELPQIANVLKGDMRIVGPRPCLPCEYAAFGEKQSLRFSVKPGITGLWQVSGKNRLTFRQMIGLDESYVHTRSFWLDLKILARTPGVLVGQVAMQRKNIDHALAAMPVNDDVEETESRAVG